MPLIGLIVAAPSPCNITLFQKIDKKNLLMRNTCLDAVVVSANLGENGR